MNLIDMVLIGLVLLYMLNGYYRGFLPSVANLGGFIISWISGLIFYPALSKTLASTEFFTSMRCYIEGAERVGDFELAHRALSSFSPQELSSTLEAANAKLPPPYDTAVVNNIRNLAFKSEGLTTLGEYFDASIYYVIINILAFLLLFIAIRIVLTLITNSVTYAAELPELRHFDRTIGAGVGLVRAFLSMYVVFTLIPIALILMPIDFVTNIINSSFFSNIFYNGSILLRSLC